MEEGSKTGNEVVIRRAGGWVGVINRAQADCSPTSERVSRRNLLLSFRRFSSVF